MRISSAVDARHMLRVSVTSVERLPRFRVSSRESRLHCSSDVKGPSLNAPYGPLASMHVVIPRVDLRKKI